MVRQPRSTYRFEFPGGLSLRGEVRRTITAGDGIETHRIWYGLDDLRIVAGIGRPLPASVADLIDVSAAIYIADRLAPRKSDGHSRFPGDRWHRRIHVILPLRHPERWRQSEVITLLKALLAFLTDDSWSFEFVDRSCFPRSAEAQPPYLKPPDRQAAVALHSGGLDSLLGLMNLLTDRTEDLLVPVTVITNDRVRCAADSVVQELRRSSPLATRELQPAGLRVKIFGSGRPRDDREPTQRARAMLFLATGIAAAMIAGGNLLRVCENGIGAISLPMTPDHWGARATRAMHPKTLVLMSELAARQLDQHIAIENIGLYVTKGEHARRFANEGFLAAARQTVSCDRASYMAHGEACGKCSSCILRRVALNAAGLDAAIDEHALTYRTDWFDAGASWNSEDTLHLAAMRDQVERLREATREDGDFAALDLAFPELFDVVAVAPALGLTRDEMELRLIRLYRNYVHEFDAFVARIDRPGWGRRAGVTALATDSTEAAAG